MEKKANLTLAILFYIAMCALVFIVVVGYLQPINTPKDYDTLENTRPVYIEAR